MDNFMIVKSINDFLDKLQANKLGEGSHRFFRGHEDSTYKFLPSVLRNENLVTNEHSIYNDILVECPNNFKSCISNSEKLTIMQHYGVKTRLLDITSNPLIAMFFACHDESEKYEKDGSVLLMDVPYHLIKPYDSDSVSILSALPKFDSYEKKRMRSMINDYNEDKMDLKEFNRIDNPNDDIIARLLHEIKKEQPAFENIIDPNDLLDNFVFSPQKQNDRIIRQSGAFIIFGLDYKTIDTYPDFCRFPKIKQPNVAKNTIIETKRLIIEKNSKEIILEQLASLGITQASIYPELYKVSEFINKKYSSGS